MTTTFRRKCGPLANHSASRSRGFTIIELMVGLTIGMLLVAGLSLLFANSSRTGIELEKSIRQIENGRYAIESLHDDIALAGFYGEVPGNFITYSTPSVCATALADLGWDKTVPSDPKVPMPIMGLTATQAAALPSTCIVNHLTGTAAFAIHRLSTDAVAPASIAGSSPYVQTSRCNTDPVSSPFILSKTAADFTLKNYACTAQNEVRQFVSRIYYVSSCNDCSTGGDTIPTLKMAELQGDQMVSVPVAEGVENLVVEYGFDGGGGEAATFRSELNTDATAIDGTWANVVAARVHLLTRTTEKTQGFSDLGKTYVMGQAASVPGDNSGFKRRVYTTTVRLTNVAGPREVATSPSTPTP